MARRLHGSALAPSVAWKPRVWLKTAKWKTVSQMLAMGPLLMNHDPFGIPLEATGRIVLWAATALTLWSGYGYFSAYFQRRAAP